MARRQHLTLMVALVVVGFLSISYLMSGTPSSRYSQAELLKQASKTELMKQADDSIDIAKEAEKADFGLPSAILTGGAIAPKLENKTAKAELGRASWKLLHTMMAKFPDKPTADDSLTLKTYVQLFARLYPCGECAEHFQKLLKKYPPQVSSRNAAAGWACFVHNEVNTRLKKELFDCNKIGDFYDCGCGDEDKKKAGSETDSAGGEKTVKTQKSGEKNERANISIEKEGLTRGG